MSILYPHQQKAVRQALPILEAKGIVYLACEPRFGKSLVALALAELRGWDGTLVVTKKKAIDGWMEALALASVVGVFVTNYEALHKVEGKYQSIIVDEGHRIGSFPKMCKAGRYIKAMNFDEMILLSGTPSVESGCQLFHQFAVSKRSPYSQSSFFNWHRAGYGIPSRRKIAGRQVNDWSKCNFDNVIKVVSPYIVTGTQEQAGFGCSVEVNDHIVEDRMLKGMIDEIMKNGVLMVGDQKVVAEGGAARLQKAHMIAGGTCIDENGEAVFVGSRKTELIASKVQDGRQHVVFTQYVAERELLLNYLDDATDDIERFRGGEFSVFVGSIKSYCEGTDFSWVNGEMWIYSLTWSGSTYLQILDRMSNIKRKENIIVNVIHLEGGIDQRVHAAVKGKQSFNLKFYNRGEKTA